MNQISEQANRRAHPRLRCSGVAEMTVYPKGTKCKGMVVDLGMGGCCIEVDRPIEGPSGSRVELKLSAMGTAVQLAGVLCYVRKQVLAGIQFAGVNVRNAYQLKELMDVLSREPGADSIA